LNQEEGRHPELVRAEYGLFVRKTLLPLCLVIVPIGLFVWLMMGRGALAENDLDGAKEIAAEGKVEQVLLLPDTRNIPLGRALVTVNWSGKTGQIQTSTIPSKGDRVAITFKVGKSGHIYIGTLRILKPAPGDSGKALVPHGP
jgi:hypothetical protein